MIASPARSLRRDLLKTDGELLHIHIRSLHRRASRQTSLTFLSCMSVPPSNSWPQMRWWLHGEVAGVQIANLLERVNLFLCKSAPALQLAGHSQRVTPFSSRHCLLKLSNLFVLGFQVFVLDHEGIFFECELQKRIVKQWNLQQQGRQLTCCSLY